MPHGKLALAPVLLTALIALGNPPSVRAADDALAADQRLLNENGVSPTAPGILGFFRKRTLSDDDRKKLDQLVTLLGSRRYRDRSRGFRELRLAGTPAVALLRSALNDSDPEVAMRAELCLAKIAGGPGPELPAAAARLLVHLRPKGAAPALLNYLPYADDEWLEEEVFACLGQLAIHGGKVDPIITAALKDKLAARRGIAAYLLGRMGDLNQRAVVRQLLDDPDPKVRLRANQGLVGKDILRSAEDSGPADEALLKEQKIPTDGAGMLAFFRKRTLSQADQRKFQNLVRQLGDKRYRRRQQATRLLTELGSSALAFLRPAATDADDEIRDRARRAMEKIENGPGMNLPTAAVHVLLRRAPPEALETLLAYVPFADDTLVEDEVLKAMCVLAARDVKIAPALITAVHDPLPARRGAAAYVLGHVGTRADCLPARRLFKDASVQVRLRTAQGFIAAKDKNAVSELIQLLGESRDANAQQLAEETLSQVAGNDPPAMPDPRTHQAVQKAWASWWEKDGGRIDLARVQRREGFQNLRVVCEWDWNGRWNAGTVWEADRSGKPRWHIDNLLGPMDAHVLPNRNVLVAEFQGRKVTERDQKGNVKWEMDLTGARGVNGNPVVCQRLPNGNTFIACYYNIMEVTKDHKIVYNHTRGPNTYIFGAHRMANGHVVTINSIGQVEEIDVKNKGHVVRSFNVPNQGNWCSVEGLRNGRFLVAMMNQNKVMEVDDKGKEYWSCSVVGVHTATRMPNGNTLVACMNNRLVKEFDRGGKEVWTQTVAGRPWRIHYR